MRSFRWCFAAVAALVGGSGPLDWISRFGSPELRAHDARTTALRQELAALPLPPDDHSSARIGWHSTFNFMRAGTEASRSVLLDLGAIEAFDSVVLVPVNVADGTRPGPGYGFPVRFRVEAADERTFTTPVILADHSAADFPNPGNLPVCFETPGARGRYVRVTATRLFSRGAEALFALGELMVWRGATNLAFGKSAFTSGNYENAPTWQLANLNDGQTVLGPPVRVAPAPSNGYHSRVAVREDEAKWVQLDLGRAVPIDEVRLFAARPIDFPARSGFGFPLRFRLEASNTPDFSESTVLVEYRDVDCVNPGDNPLIVPGGRATARYIRMTATRLWERHHDFVFALSEMQVFSGGENVARNAEAAALDSISINRWSLAFLRDGFISQGELVDWPAWLRELSRRRELAQELARWESGRGPLVVAMQRRLRTWAASALAILAALASGWTLRQRAGRRRELARLRQRIAGDLHDEIGSNLGSIALLAGMAAEQLPEEARADIVQIQHIARETAESMRDIVWLMRPGPRNTADLLTRMREVAAQQLGGLAWSFEAGGVTGPFPLELEREWLLLFKEALHNIGKHARARRVTIQFTQDGNAISLSISDDGVGFDPAAPVGGVGLAGMRHRARLLGGQLALRTQPGAGTELKLEARLP